MNKKKIIGISLLPLVLITIFTGLRFGFISPMIKGLDIKIYGGTFITNLNKYVIKVGDKVGLSTGNYIVVPAFSKNPKLRFAILDNNGVLKLENNTLTANKVGYSSIGILNKNRVLKKATIMVVNPKIENMDITLSNPIKIYGDEAKIIGNVKIDDYKKLEKGYKLKYKSSNPNILKVKNNIIEAVGIGDVKLIARYDRQEIQKQFKILPRIDSIELDKVYELEVNQSIQIHPTINTSPHNSKVDVEYTVLDSSLNKINTHDIQGINIDKNGILYANNEGRYRLRVSSGDKYKDTIVDVKPPSFKNIEIKNLQYSYTIKNNKIILELGFDYNKYVKYYQIYLSSQDKDYQLVDEIYRRSGIGHNGNRIVDVLNLEYKKDQVYKIYVVGVKNRGVNINIGNKEDFTKKSNVITVDESSKNYSKLKVSGIKYRIDKENNSIYFSWDKIDKSKYRIYSKTRIDNRDKYNLILNNIPNNHAVVKFDGKNIDSEFYIVSISSKGQISDFSAPQKIQVKFAD